MTCPECSLDQTANGEPLYECGQCGEIFTRDESADGDSSRCPDCNKFSSRVGTRCECGTDVLPGPGPEVIREPCRVTVEVLQEPIPITGQRPSFLQKHPDRTHVLARYTCPAGDSTINDPAWRDQIADRTWRCLNGHRCLADGATVTITGEVTP